MFISPTKLHSYSHLSRIGSYLHGQMNLYFRNNFACDGNPQQFLLIMSRFSSVCPDSHFLQNANLDRKSRHTFCTDLYYEENENLGTHLRKSRRTEIVEGFNLRRRNLWRISNLSHFFKDPRTGRVKGCYSVIRKSCTVRLLPS